MPELPPYRDEANPVWERRVNELEKGEGIGQVTQAKTASEFFPQRMVYETGCVIKEAEAETAGQAYLLNAVGTTGIKTAAKVAKFGEVLPGFFVTTQPGQEVTGRTLKYQLYVQILVGTAPTGTITFGIYEVESLTETEKQTEPTVNLTAKSTCAFATPAAKASAVKTGASVTLANATAFMVGFTLSATTAAKSLVVAKAQVFANDV